MKSALLLWLLLSGCAAYDDGSTPAGAVKRFLQIMDRSSTDEGALREAYALLDDAARQALQRRARKAATLAGRDYEPWEMLAQGRFRLRFAPRAGGGIKAKVDGDEAIVTVRGEKDGQIARVPLVKQDGRWRIRLEIGAMAGGSVAGAIADTPATQ